MSIHVGDSECVFDVRYNQGLVFFTHYISLLSQCDSRICHFDFYLNFVCFIYVYLFSGSIFMCCNVVLYVLGHFAITTYFTCSYLMPSSLQG